MNICCINDQVNQDVHVSFRILHDLGYRHVEVHAINHNSIEEASERDIADIENAAKKYNMNIVALASTVFMMTSLHNQNDISDFNPAFYKIEGSLESHLHHLKKVCTLANRLNCHVVRVFPFRASDNQIILGSESDIQKMIEPFKKAVSIAKEHNVVLAVENCPYSYLPKGNMTFELVKKIDSAHLKLLYDPGNSYRANKDRLPPHYLNTSILDELDYIFPYVEHIHLKDYKYDLKNPSKPFKHVAFTKGDVPIKEIIDYLKANNYTKALSCEPEVSYHETIESLKTLCLLQG